MLFGVERPGITQHIKNIFSEAELQENSVRKDLLRTEADGKNTINEFHQPVNFIEREISHTFREVLTSYQPE